MALTFGMGMHEAWSTSQVTRAIQNRGETNKPSNPPARDARTLSLFFPLLRLHYLQMGYSLKGTVTM